MASRRKRRRAAAAVKVHKRQARRRTRRRSNPAMMPVVFANPHRGGHKTVSRRRRRRHHHHATPPTHRSSSRRRRHHHAAPVRRRRLNPMYAVRVSRRRRRNPTEIGQMGIGTIVVCAGVGGLGIVWARIVGKLYTDHVSSYVRGTDAKVTWRQWLDEALRLALMELGVYVVERGMKSAGVGQVYRTAFFVGGTAEVGRQTVGVAIKMLSPTTDRAKFGLDGMRGGMGALEPSAQFPTSAFIAPDGNLYTLRGDGSYQLEGLVRREDLSGLVPRSAMARAAA